jgi:hypothetical protein
MENEINTTLPEKPKELPEQLPDIPLPVIEMPNITPSVKTKEITDSKLDDYTESLNSLVTKYSKYTSEKK